MTWPHQSPPSRRAAPNLDPTRITLARVLELGVQVSWREAAAIVHGAIARTGAAERPGPARVTTDSVVLTRGGDVVLTGAAAQARPEALVPLLDDLLAFCPDPGRWASAVADGTALEMLDGLSDLLTARRRRVEVASVALRGLAAAADAARALEDADDSAVEGAAPSTVVDEVVAAPSPPPSPSARRRPWPPARQPVSTIPLSGERAAMLRRDPVVRDVQGHEADVDDKSRIAVDLARERPAPERAAASRVVPPPLVNPHPGVEIWSAPVSIDDARTMPRPTPVRTATEAGRGEPSRSRWGRRAAVAALVCLVLASVGTALLLRQPPTTRPAAGDPFEPAVDTPGRDAPIAARGEAPLADADPDPGPAAPPETAELPLPVPVPAPSDPRGSPIVEDRSALPAAAQDPGPASVPPRPAEPPAPVVRALPPPAGPPQTPAQDTAPVAPPPSPSSTQAAVVPPPVSPSPDAASTAAAPPPATATPPPAVVTAAPSAPASAPVGTTGATAADTPANADALSAARAADVRAIENVLGRYRAAFNTLDTGAARAVWPTVNERALAKAFESLESHALSFASCQIEVVSVLAEAACSGTARYVPKVGSRTPRTEARRWRFSLRKTGGGWLIDRVDAR